MKPMSIETQRELVEALETIEATCTEEINVRYGGHSRLSADEHGAKSRVYSLIVVPRNIARAALAKARAEMGGDDNG